MTREQAKQNLISIGISEPTDEQVTNYLNQVNGESKKEKDRADRLKADADKVAELQAKLDEIESQNLSDIEKANKATEDANKRVAELERSMASMKTKAKLAEYGIVGEQAEKLVSADGVVDYDMLGQIISDREKQAVSNFEKQALEGTPNPNGGQGGTEKSSAEKAAEVAAKTMADSMKASADILSAYTN